MNALKKALTTLSDRLRPAQTPEEKEHQKEVAASTTYGS